MLTPEERTCFASTNIQILTPEELRGLPSPTPTSYTNLLHKPPTQTSYTNLLHQPPTPTSYTNLLLQPRLQWRNSLCRPRLPAPPQPPPLRYLPQTCVTPLYLSVHAALLSLCVFVSRKASRISPISSTCVRTALLRCSHSFTSVFV